MGSCQRGAILGDNLSESSTLVHWNGVKWLLWVTKLAVDSELLDNVLVSVSDCHCTLGVMTQWVNIDAFSASSLWILCFSNASVQMNMAPVCSRPPELIKLHFRVLLSIFVA